MVYSARVVGASNDPDSLNPWYYTVELLEVFKPENYAGVSA